MRLRLRNANPEDLHCGILLKENGPHCGHETCRLCRMTQKSSKGIYQTATAHLMMHQSGLLQPHEVSPEKAYCLLLAAWSSLQSVKPRKLHLNYVCAATGPRATRVKKNKQQNKQKNSCYLVLNGSHVALIPPVQRTRGLQEVGLQEQGPLHLSLCFVLVAVHELPELLVGLWEQRQECN